MASPNPVAATNYATNGFLVVADLLSAEEVGKLQQRMLGIERGSVPFPREHIELEPGTADAPAAVRKINRCAECDEVFMSHATNDKILDVVEELIGPDIKLYTSQSFMKPPGGVEKPWHQDSAYFPIEPKALVTCWTALDDVTCDNGCLWVIPGSHQGPLHDHRQPWQVGDRTDMQVPDDDVPGDRAAPIVMSAGSCSFHHSMLLHRSGPNRSSNSRRGLAVHYMSSRSRWTNETQSQPDFPLLRGREHEGCV